MPWPTRGRIRNGSRISSDTGIFSTPSGTRRPTRHGLKGRSGEGIDGQTDDFKGEKYHMTGFFRSLFRIGTKPQEPTPSQPVSPIEQMSQEPTPSQPVPPIEQMSFDEILAYIQSMEATASVTECTPLIRRLYRIALYENQVPTQHRNAAIQLAETLTAQIEKALADIPDALAALQKANNSMIEDARQTGIGSLVTNGVSLLHTT
jgi:hypothetical protein